MFFETSGGFDGIGEDALTLSSTFSKEKSFGDECFIKIQRFHWCTNERLRFLCVLFD